MTTWDNTDISATYRNTHGKYNEITFEITGVSGDTGGTLTVNAFSKIVNAFVTASQAAAVVADLTHYIASNTVVVTYTNPSAGHTVKITVIGY